MLRLNAVVACLPCNAVPTTVINLVQQREVHHHMERHNLQRYLGIHRSNKAKANRNTHHNEKMFRRMRGLKTIILDLPDDVEQRKHDSLPPNELRAAMLRKGINPYKEVQPRSWQEGQITLQSFYSVADPYVAPEDPLPWLSKEIVEGTKFKADEVKHRVLNSWHNYKNGTNRIRKKEGFEKFDVKKFGVTADIIYEEAHRALMKRDKVSLHKYITEYAFEKMWHDVEEGSIVWEMVERLSPSKVITVRCMDNPIDTGNDIAQLTVRMHTLQKLAIYDRFGKLILGSETEPKETVEYVVFENHIAVVDGVWRLHDKVYPKWVEPKRSINHSFPIETLDESSRPTHATELSLHAEVLEAQKKLS